MKDLTYEEKAKAFVEACAALGEEIFDNPKEVVQAVVSLLLSCITNYAKAPENIMPCIEKTTKGMIAYGPLCVEAAIALQTPSQHSEQN